MQLGSKLTSQDRVGSTLDGRLDLYLIWKNARFEKITASPSPVDRRPPGRIDAQPQKADDLLR